MKKAKQILLLVAMVFLVLACNKEDVPKPVDPAPIDNTDPDLEPEPENQAPSSFSLLAPEMDKTNSPLRPTFVWEQATDPNGDIVSYDIYLDTINNPLKVIAADLNETSFETMPLEFDLQYFWKIVAKDAMGGEKSSEVFSFSTKVMPNLVSYTEIFGNDPPQLHSLVYDDEERVEVIEYYNYTNSVFYDSSGRVSSILPDRYPATNYTYDPNGQLKVIEELRRKRNWIFSRDNQGRIFEIQRNVLSGSATTYELKYINHPDLPSEIWRNGKLAMQYIWDSNGNPIKELGYDSEGKLTSSRTLVFDDKNNPWYTVIAEKLGFQEMFVIGEDFWATGGFTFVDYPVLRITRNNLLSYSGFNEFITFSAKIVYEYNDEGFPVESIRMRSENGDPKRQKKTIYKYREQE